MLVLVVLALLIMTAIAGRLAYRLKHPQYDGMLNLFETDTKQTFSFDVRKDPDLWQKQKYIVLGVVHKSPEESRE